MAVTKDVASVSLAMSQSSHILVVPMFFSNPRKSFVMDDPHPYVARTLKRAAKKVQDMEESENDGFVPFPKT